MTKTYCKNCDERIYQAGPYDARFWEHSNGLIDCPPVTVAELA